MKRTMTLLVLGFAAAIGVAACDSSDLKAKGEKQEYLSSDDVVYTGDIPCCNMHDEYWEEDAMGYPESADVVSYAGEGGDGEWGGQPNVKAGVYNDNDNFADYLAYLDSFADLANAIKINVSERYVISLVATESQRSLPGALLTIVADDKVLFEGTTLPNGQVLFHPLACGLTGEPEVFHYTVAVDDEEVAAGSFDRLQAGGEVAIEVPVQVHLPETIRIDMALVLDTTGSMSDEIQKLKATYKLVAQQINAITPGIDARFGMVLYRDRGDDYVTQLVDFTNDTQHFVDQLAAVSADGGGDNPEDLQAALDDALNQLQWRSDAHIKVLFTLLDAPPQLYPDEVPYPELLSQAVAEGIHIHAIAASGSNEPAEYVSRQMAQFAFGHFLFLTYSNDVPGKPGSGTGSGGDDGYNVKEYLSGTLDQLMVKLVTIDVHALLDLPLPGLDPDPQPTEDTCSDVTYFECGFMAYCSEGTIVAEWHEHQFEAGEEIEEIVDYSCHVKCPNGCTSGDILDWPESGTDLAANFCL